MFLFHTHVFNDFDLLMAFLIETHAIQCGKFQLTQVKLSLTLFRWFQKINYIVLNFLHGFFNSVFMIGYKNLRVSFAMGKFFVKGFYPFILREEFVVESK